MHEQNVFSSGETFYCQTNTRFCFWVNGKKNHGKNQDKALKLHQYSAVFSVTVQYSGHVVERNERIQQQSDSIDTSKLVLEKILKNLSLNYIKNIMDYASKLSPCQETNQFELTRSVLK